MHPANSKVVVIRLVRFIYHQRIPLSQSIEEVKTRNRLLVEELGTALHIWAVLGSFTSFRMTLQIERD